MPILVPVLKAMGIHLVWFGIIMVTMLGAALVRRRPACRC